MKSAGVKLLLIVVSLLAMGVLINIYYWSNNSLASIKYVPLYVMIFAFVYILLQILKRYLFKDQNWWDWLYYIGLIAMMLPTLLANDTNAKFFIIFSHYGMIFLLLPVVIDAYYSIKRNK